jgi:RNA polymerase sigma-70 factor (ECF subfamily)
MEPDDRAARWRRLWGLLEPIHDQALQLARRLGRSSPDGDDAFQEAVLRSFEKLHTLRDETSFRSWFCTVLLSVHRSSSSRGFWRRFLPLTDEWEYGREPVGENGQRWEEERQRATRVSRALATLPAVQREAVVFFELEGFSIDEIAALQKVSPSAVKSRLARGRERLRRHYERLGFAAQRAEPPEPGTVGPPPALLEPVLPQTAPAGAVPRGARELPGRPPAKGWPS